MTSVPTQTDRRKEKIQIEAEGRTREGKRKSEILAASGDKVGLRLLTRPGVSC